MTSWSQDNNFTNVSVSLPSKLGYVRDETHRSRKTETKTQVKRKGKKGRAIKKPNKKGGNTIKN